MKEESKPMRLKEVYGKAVIEQTEEVEEKKMRCEICLSKKRRIFVVLKAFGYDSKLMCSECSICFLNQFCSFDNSETEEFLKWLFKDKDGN